MTIPKTPETRGGETADAGAAVRVHELPCPSPAPRKRAQQKIWENGRADGFLPELAHRTAMGLPQHRAEWDELGRVDPLWAVLSAKDKRFGGWSHEEFFETGQRKIAHYLERAARHRLPIAHGRVLDFGCGAGRLTRALAQHFDQAIGVDIAPSMIQTARELNGEVANCRFAENNSGDLQRFDGGGFDAVVSDLVLQHMPGRNMILGYIGEFVRVLRAGGIAIFQLPCGASWRRRIQGRRRLYRLLHAAGFSADFLQRRLKLNPIAMQWVPEDEVTRFVRSLPGAEIVEIERDGDAAPFASRTYYVTRS